MPKGKGAANGSLDPGRQAAPRAAKEGREGARVKGWEEEVVEGLAGVSGTRVREAASSTTEL